MAVEPQFAAVHVTAWSACPCVWIGLPLTHKCQIWNNCGLMCNLMDGSTNFHRAGVPANEAAESREHCVLALLPPLSPEPLASGNGEEWLWQDALVRKRKRKKAIKKRKKATKDGRERKGRKTRVNEHTVDDECDTLVWSSTRLKHLAPSFLKAIWNCLPPSHKCRHTEVYTSARPIPPLHTCVMSMHESQLNPLLLKDYGQ